MNPNLPTILHNFTLSEPQRTAALAQGNDVAVTAGAGTGKTLTLVARYLALLANDVPLRQIVAVTFTRKATREMRNRVRQKIGTFLLQLDQISTEIPKWQAYYNELDAARIGTIHNLCGEILRTHPAEAGIDPRFTVLDETQSALLIQESMEAVLAWAVESSDLTPLFELLGERQLQELIIFLLNTRQTVQEIISQISADTILDHWQGQLHAAQERILAQLLTDPGFNDAIKTLTLNQATNPDDKAEQQRQIALSALHHLDRNSLAGKLRNLVVLGEIDLRGGSQKSWPNGMLNEVKEALRSLRDLYRQQSLLTQSLNAQDKRIAAAMPAIYTLFQYAYQTYQGRKAEREALDFDDLESQAIHLLESNPDVRHYWQGQIQAMLVDEFQDTNEQQRQFIRLLCPEPGKLFIVGDAKQSIYRFRGADVTVFATEKERIKHKNGYLVDLDTSYRAHEELLEGMNDLLGPTLGSDSPYQPPWVAPFVPLEPGNKPVEHDLSSPFIEFHLTFGTKDEALPRAATALASKLMRLHLDKGLDYGDIAILCRASSAFQYYENALDDAGIPYLTVAGKGFYDRPEIRDLLNALQAIADPHDTLALVGFLRSPACGLSDITLYRLNTQRLTTQSLWDTLQQHSFLDDVEEMNRLQTAVALIRDLHQQAGRTPVADIFKQFLDRTYYRAILRRAGQPRALRNVAKLLADIHTSELVNIAEFLEYAQTLRDSGSREGEARATAGGAVQIMSIHAAKGLEFPLVVLGDVGSTSTHSSRVLMDSDSGILLSAKSEEQEQAASYQMGASLVQEQEEAETARLLYVALTRAEQLLMINGNIQQNKSGSLSWKGWLAQLADIIGLNRADLSGYDETGSSQHVFDFSLPKTAVRAFIYEPHITFPAVQSPSLSKERTIETLTLQPLQEPIATDTLPEPTDNETPQRVWQVVPTTRQPEAPAWVIGSLVHEALALWRFPEADYDVWVAARAREYGLTNSQQLKHAQVESRRLLQRFQQHKLFQEIMGAKKQLHEVPYSYERNGTTETGYIDLLYRHNNVWKLVDFKTDKIRDKAALQKLLAEKDYIQQIQRYGTAVQHLLGITPQLMLVFLNFENDVHVVDDYQ